MPRRPVAFITGAKRGIGKGIALTLAEQGYDGRTRFTTPNLSAFSGQSPCFQAHGSSVIVNTHNRHPVLGSLGLLHSHRPVFPLTFGPPDSADDWSLRDWAGQCHRKKGLVVWTEPFSARLPHAGESLALAMLGEIDAYEITPDEPAQAMRGWYQLLNAGTTLPLVGASARTANDRPIGAMQSIVCHNGGIWTDWVRYGPTITNSAVPNVCQDNDTLYFSALSGSAFDRVELIINGKSVANAKCEQHATDFVACSEHKFDGSGWAAARVIKADGSQFAHTSAIRIGEPKPEPEARALLRTHLEKARDWVESEGRYDDPRSKVKLLDTFNEAMAKLS